MEDIMSTKTCKTVGQEQHDGCQKMMASTKSINKVKIAAQKAKANMEKKTVKKSKNEHGFVIGSSTYKVYIALTIEAMKQKEIKELFGNTYYNFCGAHPEVFGKTENKIYYVKGSKAEKKALKLEATTKKTEKSITKKGTIKPVIKKTETKGRGKKTETKQAEKTA